MSRTDTREMEFAETVKPQDLQTANSGGGEGSQQDAVYVFPASLEQSRYWILDQLAGASTASNMAVAFRMEGPVRDDLVEICARELVVRHEALRTNFQMVDGVLSQVISEEPRFGFSISDLRVLPEASRANRAEELIHEHSRVRFDLANGALFHVHLIHVTDTDHFLALTMHHIVCDGWSNGILIRDFALYYEAALTLRNAEMPELPFQFADFTVWQQEWLESEAADNAMAYWKQHIQRDMPAIDLPADFPRAAEKSAPGDIVGRLLPTELTARLKNYCRKHDATMHQVLLAAFEAIISRYAGQDEFLLGSTIANRTQPGMENVVGRFAHPQVVLADVQGDPTYSELVKRVANWSANSYAHQDLPFSRLTEAFQLDQEHATSQFLQVYFVYQKAFMQPQQAGPLRIVPRPSVSGGVNFDMLVSIVERGEGPRLQVEYNTKLFRQERVSRLIELYIRVLEAVMDDDSLRVSALPLLSHDEQAKLAASAVANSVPETARLSLTAAFDRIAEKNGNTAALIFGEHRTSWSELQQKSLGLARAMQNAGVRAGATVAVRLEQSAEAAASVLATLRLGAVVLPVPASVSSVEWQTIQAEFKPVLSLSSETFAEKFAAVTSYKQLAEIDSPSATLPEIDAAAPAWIAPGADGPIYSSHAASFISLQAAAQAMDLQQGSVILASAASSATDAWTDLMLPLVNGAAVISAEGINPTALQAVLDREQVSFVFSTAPEIVATLRGGWTGDRRLHAICRGSHLSPATAAELLQSPGRYSSLISSASTAGPLAFAALSANGLVIAPLPGESFELADDAGRPVAFSVPGHLVVRRGTAESRPSLRVRFTPDAGFELLDASDRFVNHNGYRIRLGELEELLTQEPSVATAAAALVPDAHGKASLVAYVTGHSGTLPSSATVSAWLKAHAAAHLAAAEILPVPAIPHRLDGSPDISALPQPGSSVLAAEADAGYVPPRDELEKNLVSIWESVLGVPGIGIRTNFFSLGGYSLMIVRLFATINRTLSLSLPITTIFNAPTVEQLADIIRGRTLYSPLVPVQPRGDKPPFFLVHSYLLYGGLPSVLGEDYPFYGLREIEDRDKSMTMEQRAASYAKEIRSVQPHGPYYLGGWCAAGPLAVETARALTDAGEEVRTVMLFDSWRPGYSKELESEQKNRPDMALKAVLSRKYRFHRMKMRPLSAAHKVKYIGSAALHKFNGVKGRMYMRNWALAQRLFKLFGLPLPHFMHNVSLETFEAVRTYNPKQFPGRITLMRATQAIYIPGAEEGCGWGKVARDGVEVLWAPGDHESMFMEPNLASVGSSLRNTLEKARSADTAGV
ncbi:condensation domain-containing protein [Silvibacterium acidisoli]|uniref:condensation domain-containing protein n=1 Tax=Acidobacteriaceae bacterium ZG23-2 TaxID=2883246 RepID=UPI00406C491E